MVRSSATSLSDNDEKILDRRGGYEIKISSWRTRGKNPTK